MEKYYNLKLYLEQSTKNIEKLTYKQIEEIIKSELPKSARIHRTWWSNNSKGHTQARAWLNSGWKVDKIELGFNVSLTRYI
ncbi:MAG TPA: hypothetical protein P5282_08715 [Anaerolineaceae bacterium]|jgi:hypothetical protein|nr:hypothetical protein [Anaerolineaceae bacterium]